MLLISVGERQYPTKGQPSLVEGAMASHLSEVGIARGQGVKLAGDLPSGLVLAMCQQVGAIIVTDGQPAHRLIAYPNGVESEQQQEEMLKSARSLVVAGGQMLLALGSKHGWTGAKELLHQLGPFKVLANVRVSLEESDRGQLKRWREMLDDEPRIFRRDRFDGLGEDPKGYDQIVRIVAVQIA